MALVVAVTLAIIGGKAISAQDKYSVQVPDGLAFAEFRGYETWQLIAVSQTETLLVAILGLSTYLVIDNEDDNEAVSP